MYLRDCKIQCDNISERREAELYEVINCLQNKAPSDAFIKMGISRSLLEDKAIHGSIKVSSINGVFSSDAEGVTFKEVVMSLKNTIEDKISIWKLSRCFTTPDAQKEV